jgi:uncharacterized protein YbbC (DUF1343 family)/CubicO group peptidase (beta-lactamase class C family)
MKNDRRAGFWVLLALFAVIAIETGSAASGPQQFDDKGKSIADAADVHAVADFCWIDDLVEEAIREEQLPGAVILIGQNEQILYRKAFGHRAVVPALEPMTVDTIFDLASLTKVVATTTGIMQLVETGRISLDDPVSRYIPQFKRHGKSNITVRHLLTHMSGLKPGLNSTRQWSGYREAIAQIVDDEPVTAPGERIVYSDLNFILLGEILRRVSGRPIELYVPEYILKPLGMRDSMFNPPANKQTRIAPTERCRKHDRSCGPAGTILRGQVHDATARRMGAGAGHAGLFSTADDLSIFCRMLLNGGILAQTRILSLETIDTIMSPSTPLNNGLVRGLGWNIDITFDERQKKRVPLPVDHSGFTGTKLWLDPVSGLYIVFLSNRLHPNGKGDVFDLREHIITIAANFAAGRTRPAESATGVKAASLRRPNGDSEKAERRGQVFSGLDVLRAEAFDRIRGGKIGLLTNHTGQARDGASTIDLLYNSDNVQLISLFSPEHGIRGIRNDRVPSSRDQGTGLKIHSLYGRRVRPTAQMLAGLDTLVVDLQDIGTRFYTYMTTMAYMLEAAAKHKIRFVVLDRPNPINGLQIEGPILDRKFAGFTGYFPMPVRHGLTMGELARLFNGENGIGADLAVVKMKGWRRQYWFDETGLPWVNPSPNMRNLIQATLYPGIGAIEGTRISVGRGTDTPFEQFGAHWINAVHLATELNARGLAGARFYPVSFTPQSSTYAGQKCHGVFILVTDRQALQPVRLGLEVSATLHRLYPNKYRLENEKNLLGSVPALSHILAGGDPAGLLPAWRNDENRWRQLRRRYLLYPE